MFSADFVCAYDATPTHIQLVQHILLNLSNPYLLVLQKNTRPPLNRNVLESEVGEEALNIPTQVSCWRGFGEAATTRC